MSALGLISLKKTTNQACPHKSGKSSILFTAIFSSIFTVLVCFVAILIPDSLQSKPLVILDDGCPRDLEQSNFSVTCMKTPESNGSGEHASSLLSTLNNIASDSAIPVRDLVFIDIADSENKSSADQLMEGIKLAHELDPALINISYSFSRSYTEIDELLETLHSDKVPVFSSYSNLFLDEESYPASSSFVTGVKVGNTTTRETDNSILLESALVSRFSNQPPSTSHASIIISLFYLICRDNARATENPYNMCSLFQTR